MFGCNLSIRKLAKRATSHFHECDPVSENSFLSGWSLIIGKHYALQPMLYAGLASRVVMKMAKFSHSYLKSKRNINAPSQAHHDRV
ncbi:hypothetical protein A1OO_13850 [Enterovibrio norvegicus FF-33]|nr:hypothetical protein A1OO_13850 [Enterovibrio norvegicus FF-33]